MAKLSISREMPFEESVKSETELLQAYIEGRRDTWLAEHSFGKNDHAARGFYNRIMGVALSRVFAAHNES